MKRLYRFTFGFVQYICLILTGLLALAALVSSCTVLDMTTQETLLSFDNPVLTLLGLIAYAAVCAGLSLLALRHGAKGRRLLLLLTLLYLCGIGVILILFARVVPGADALSVYYISLSLSHGDTSVINPSSLSYLAYYPQQIGLVGFLELLLRLWAFIGIDEPGWHFLKGIYVLLTCLIVWSLYRIVLLVCRKHADEICVLLLFLVVCDAPLLLYSQFVYSEIPSLAFFCPGVYLLLLFLRALRQAPIAGTSSLPRFLTLLATGIGSILCIALAVLLRKNTLIFLIAVVLLLLVEMLRLVIPSPALSSPAEDTQQAGAHVLPAEDASAHAVTDVSEHPAAGSSQCAVASTSECANAGGSERLTTRATPRPAIVQALGLFLFTLCLITASLAAQPLCTSYYEHRAGNVIGDGVTASSYIAMGMQDGSRGPGWYNGFNYDTYEASGMAAEAANRISRTAIGERLSYFQAHPSKAFSFYLRKELTQWVDGTYAARQATLSEYGDRSAFFTELYVGSYSTLLISWCNLWQNALYLGSFLFCLRGVLIRRRHRPMTPNTAPATEPMAPDAAAYAKAPEEASAGALPPVLYLGLIAALGGFLFHTIWEANSRYIFPYSVLLLPYGAYGLWWVCASSRILPGGSRRSRSTRTVDVPDTRPTAR